MFPELSPGPEKPPQGSIDLGNGFLLLPKKDKNPQLLRDLEVDALQSFFTRTGQRVQLPVNPRVTRWSRLLLPNGQIARSLMKEGQGLEGIRMARNVKVSIVPTMKVALC